MTDTELIIKLVRENYELKSDLEMYKSWVARLDREAEERKAGEDKL